MKPLEQFADEKDGARFQENQEIARSNRTLRGQLREREDQLADVRRRLGIYEALDHTSIASGCRQRCGTGC